MKVTPPLARALAAEDPATHATASNVRLGREIAAAGDVEVIESTGSTVVAKVGGGQRRTASFSLTAGRLAWHCTCRRDQPPWCKHLVALAVACSADA